MELVLYWNENENFHLLGKCVFFPKKTETKLPPPHKKEKNALRVC